MRLVHSSDCPVNNAPALPPGPCDCNAFERYCEDVARASLEIAKSLNPKIHLWDETGVHNRAGLIGAVRTQVCIEAAIRKLED